MSEPVEVTLTRRSLAFLVFDLAVVISFAVFGRNTHNEALGLAATLGTAAPFLMGLIAAWLVPQLRRQPGRIASGAAIAVLVTGIGLIARVNLFSDGISGAFPYVAAGYLGGLMVAGRALPVVYRRVRLNADAPGAAR